MGIFELLAASSFTEGVIQIDCNIVCMSERQPVTQSSFKDMPISVCNLLRS